MDKDDTSKTWRAAFAPFLVPHGEQPATPWWRIVMAKTGTKIAIVALSLLVGGGLVVHRNKATPTPERPETPAAITIDRHARVLAQPGIAMQSLTGRVTFHDRPFTGATIHVSHVITREQLGEATSASDGTFTISNLPPASLVVTAAAVEKIATPLTVDLRSPAARGKRIELRLEGCVHLRGIVSDGTGIPIAHTHIAPDVGQAPFTDTDELGRYDLCTHLGYQRIRYAANGYHAIRIETRLASDFIQDVTLLPEAIVAGTVLDAAGLPAADAAVTIDPLGKNGIQRGQDLPPITIEMDQVGSICGTVSDETGARLRGIRVSANNRNADDSGDGTSDDAGAFCIRSLRNEGTFEISTWRGGQEIKPVSPLPHVTLVKGEATLPIVLAAPDKQIAGTVVDDTGGPVPDAAVRVTTGKYFSNDLDVAVTDASGHFAIQRLAPGSYQVSATARDGSSHRGRCHRRNE